LPQPQNLVDFSVRLTQSSYSIEERSVASVWVRERQRAGQTLSQVMAAFWERFNKSPPQRSTLLDWKKGAFALGSVNDTALCQPYGKLN
jgi:hypothetical protein